MGTRKDFLLIYTQFGHAPSKRFTSPGLRNLSRRVTLYEHEQVVGVTLTTGIFRKMYNVGIETNEMGRACGAYGGG